MSLKAAVNTPQGNVNTAKSTINQSGYGISQQSKQISLENKIPQNTNKISSQPQLITKELNQKSSRPSPNTAVDPIQKAKDEKASEQNNYYANIGFSLYKQSISLSSTDQKFNEIIEHCHKTKKKWTDPDFPPEFRSLWGYGEAISDLEEDDWEDVKFARSSDIFPNGVKLFDKIESNDISQGMLGDCYFLSSLSAIAEHPKRVEKIFVVKEMNEYGVIVVKLCLNGFWIEVVIDDYFPVYKYNKTPAFTKNVGSEIWVMALEKAYAKCFGGYLNIDAGLTLESLRDLTGAPTREWDPTEDDVEELWHHIIEGERKNYIMTAGSSENDGRDQISDLGLVGSHAYSLLAAYEIIEDKNNEKRLSKGSEDTASNAKDPDSVIKLVKLRNPWGSGAQGEWKGDWSDQDYRWTPRLRKELEIVDEDDGIFCMPYETFCEYFDEVVICRYHDEYDLSIQKYKLSKKKGKRIMFEIKKKGTYYVMLTQKHRKYFPRSAEYEYSLMTCIIGKVGKNNVLKYVEGKSMEAKDVWVRCKMKPGKYFAYIRAYWNECDGDERDITFSVYSSERVEFKEITKKELGLDFLNKIYLDRGRKHLHNELKSYQAYGENNIFYGFESTDDGYGYFYYENKSQSTTLTVKLLLKHCEGIRLMYPFNNMKEAKLTVGPGERNIILYKYDDEDYKLSFSQTPEFKKLNSNQIELILQIFIELYSNYLINILIFNLENYKLVVKKSI